MEIKGTELDCTTMVFMKLVYLVLVVLLTNYHSVEDASLTMMFSGSLVGKASQAGIFLNYLAWYEWYMHSHAPEGGSRISTSSNSLRLSSFK